MLEVKNISKYYKTGAGKVKALEDINFKINDGQFVSIIGRSGSGKSTLLNVLGGLDKASSGEVLVDNTDITKLNDHKLISYRAKKIGFIFQNYNLIPNLSALENVILPMEFAKIPKNERKKRAKELLIDVGLNEDEINRKPNKLSGGQQQRVAIARSLANQPKLILADEPTGNLDEETGKKVFDLLHDLAKNKKTTIIAVTHDLEIAGKTEKTFKIKDGRISHA